jgi:putative nucleotidyltransferase with HDIG domain
LSVVNGRAGWPEIRCAWGLPDLNGWHDEPPSRSLFRTVLEAAQTVVIHDLAGADRLGLPGTVRGHGMRSLVAVPLHTVTGAAVGALSLYSQTPAHFGEQDVWTAELFAAQLAILVENETLRVKVRADYREEVRLLAALLHERDPYTGEHSARVMKYARQMARAMGLGKEETERVGYAGLLHDLGKIAFNNSSREQYGKVVARVYNEGLSFVAAEREEFGFDHAELGACVADKWRLAESLVTAIRYHHSPEALEKLEGKQRRLTALTTVTTASCTRLGVGRRAPVEALVLHALPAWAALGLGEDDEDEILGLVEAQIRQAGELVS